MEFNKYFRNTCPVLVLLIATFCTSLIYAQTNSGTSICGTPIVTVQSNGTNSVCIIGGSSGSTMSHYGSFLFTCPDMGILDGPQLEDGCFNDVPCCIGDNSITISWTLQLAIGGTVNCSSIVILPGCDNEPCTGPDWDGDGVCDEEDCFPYNPNLSPRPGDLCDDGNPNTVGDSYNFNCECEGNIVDNWPCTEDQDGDGVCDENDCSPNNPQETDGPGDSCDDGNPVTLNDTYDSNCICKGEIDICSGINPDDGCPLTLDIVNDDCTVTNIPPNPDDGCSMTIDYFDVNTCSIINIEPEVDNSCQYTYSYFDISTCQIIEEYLEFVDDCNLEVTLVSETNYSVGSEKIENTKIHIPNNNNTSNSYWETEFSCPIPLSELKFCYNGSNSLENFYIFFSLHSFESESVSNLMTQDCVEYFHLDNYSSNNIVDVGGIMTKHLRIQTSQTYYPLGIGCVELWGGLIEICDDGEDNDEDGDVDCDDEDCITPLKRTPEVIFDYSECGQRISFSAYSDITYSINSGPDIECSPISGIRFGLPCITEPLEPGTYTLEIKEEDLCPIFIDVEIEPFGEESESFCENGTFEDGTLEGWELVRTFLDGSGNKEFEPCPRGLDPAFEVFESGSISDEYLYNGQPLLSPSNSSHLVKMGSHLIPRGKQSSYSMERCFEVTDDNSPFCFTYALVLNDPHDPDEDDREHVHDPFFAWKITDIDGNIIFPQAPIFSGQDEFFDESGDVSIKGFSCESIDLEAFIGSQVCIEFIISDCDAGEGKGVHGGYAYIDGICSDCTTLAPDCNFDIPQEICASDFDLILPYPNTFDKVKFSFSVDEITWYETETFFVYSLDELSIVDLAENANFTLENEESYYLKIDLENNCSACSKTSDFIFLDSSMSVDYPDCIYYCQLGSANGFIIPGEINCDNCEVSWSPPLHFEDPSSVNPTLNTLFIHQNTEFIVEIQAGDCPSITQSVWFLGRPDLELDYTLNSDPCGYNLIGSLEVKNYNAYPVEHKPKFEIQFIEISTGLILSSYSLKFSSIQNFDFSFNSLSNEIAVEVKLLNDCFMENDCIEEFQIDLNTIDESSLTPFWRVYIPNICGSSSSTTWENFHVTFDSESDNENCLFKTNPTSIWKYRIDIYNNKSDPMYSNEYIDNTGNGCTGTELQWDGIDMNGFLAPQGLYVVEILISLYHDNDCISEDHCDSCDVVYGICNAPFGGSKYVSLSNGTPLPGVNNDCHIDCSTANCSYVCNDRGGVIGYIDDFLLFR